jgi:hypothetical protein
MGLCSSSEGSGDKHDGEIISGSDIYYFKGEFGKTFIDGNRRILFAGEHRRNASDRVSSSG